MRPAVFDFAHDNGLKILKLKHKNEDLEKLFNSLTKKRIKNPLQFFLRSWIFP